MQGGEEVFGTAANLLHDVTSKLAETTIATSGPVNPVAAFNKSITSRTAN